MIALDLDKLQVDFHPPLWDKPRRAKRAVTLMTETGILLSGIIVRYPRGSSQQIEIPEALTGLNRPEYGETNFPLTDLDRQAISHLLRDKLSYRQQPSGPPESDRARSSTTLLRKAWAARSGRRN